MLMIYEAVKQVKEETVSFIEFYLFSYFIVHFDYMIHIKNILRQLHTVKYNGAYGYLAMLPDNPSFSNFRNNVSSFFLSNYLKL